MNKYKNYMCGLDKQIKSSISQFSSVPQSCPTFCDPMDCSTPGFLVQHQLLELTQTHVHPVSDAIQPSHSLSSPSPLAFDLSQHQVFSNTTVEKHQFFGTQSSFLSNSHIHTWLLEKPLLWLDRRTFVSRVTSLPFKMLSLSYLTFQGAGIL